MVIMIWYYVLMFFGSVLTAVFSFLPVVDTLPLGMDEALSDMIGYLNAVKDLVPWIGFMFSVAMWYLSFKLTLLTLRLMRVIR